MDDNLFKDICQFKAFDIKVGTIIKYINIYEKAQLNDIYYHILMSRDLEDYKRHLTALKKLNTLMIVVIGAASKLMPEIARSRDLIYNTQARLTLCKFVDKCIKEEFIPDVGDYKLISTTCNIYIWCTMNDIYRAKLYYNNTHEQKYLDIMTEKIKLFVNEYFQSGISLCQKYIENYKYVEFDDENEQLVQSRIKEFEELMCSFVHFRNYYRKLATRFGINLD